MSTFMLYFGCFASFIMTGSVAHYMNTTAKDDGVRAAVVFYLMIATIVLTLLFSQAFREMR